jgi:hypothetical protein
MSSTISSIVGAIGSWLGGWSAHLFALLVTPPLEQVRDRLFLPPPPSPPSRGPDDDLAEAVRSLRDQVASLRDQVVSLRDTLDARERPPLYEMVIRPVPRHHPQNANSA